MKLPTPSDVLAAAEVPRQFNLHLNDQALREVNTLPPTDAGIRQGDNIDARVMSEMQVVDGIVAELLVWAEQLKQKRSIKESHVHSI